MKIEIEIDELKVFDAVVAKLHETMVYEAKRRVEEMVKLELAQGVRATARAHLKTLMDTFTLPDGRSFKQYVSDLFDKTRTSSWNERPRIQTMVESVLNIRAEEIYKELVKPHAEEFRAKLKSRITRHIFEDEAEANG